MNTVSWFLESELLTLSFDRYQRFRAVAELVNKVAGSGLQVLNVCDEDKGFALFIPNHSATSANMNTDFVAAADFPFADASFDVAVSIDLLEHIPKGERLGFVSELLRVSRKQVILAAPFRSSREAEKLIYRLTANRYLKEHLDLGLPVKDELEKILLDLGVVSWETQPNASLASWIGMLLANHLVKLESRDHLNEFYNRYFYELENRDPSYRTIYVFPPNVTP